MNNATAKKIKSYISKLRRQLAIVLTSEHLEDGRKIVDVERYYRCRAGCLNLAAMLGARGDVWKDCFSQGVRLENAKAMNGALSGIHDAISSGMLVNIEGLVFAEAFSDLLEQAEHLLDQGFFVAAGVLGRAVLEEHLRKWCDRAGCKPTAPKPTIESFKSSLYSANHLDKLTMKHVESMAAIGNDAAHAKPVNRQDIARLLGDLRDFLLQHPLPP